jgi:hydroxylaminobenzene mutase
MRLSSHLQGVMNGTFLLRAAYWLALVGTYLNWAATLAAAAWGAGGTTMPLAAGGHLSTPDQELTLLVVLRALNVAMFASCFLVLWACARRPASARLPLAC